MKRTLHFFKMICFFAFLSHTAKAQSNLTNTQQAIFEAVAPNAYASATMGSSFLGPYSTSARTYQMLIAANQLTNLTGKYLTAISFRALPTASSAWPAADVTISDFDIFLSGSVDPANRSLTFANNIVGVQTQVRSGSLTIPAGAVTVGASPNAFSFYINFTTPWLYTSGNLLIELRHPTFTGTSLSTESIAASGGPGNGYGVTASACWTGSYTPGPTATQANFSGVSIRATDILGTQQFESAILNVYPNPTSGILNVDGNMLVSKIKIHNMLGQLVLERATNSQTTTVDISHLNSGTYILEIDTETGVKKQKIVKE